MPYSSRVNPIACDTRFSPSKLKGPMTPDEVERMKELCQQIATEKDHSKFSQLLLELNELLERKNTRLDHTPSQPNTNPKRSS